MDTRLRAVFDEALELSGASRHAFLSAACGADGELRRRVERLLAAAEKDDAFLAAPTVASEPQGPGAEAEQTGAMIDRYKLLQPIGEGGFGSVWMAEQQHPVIRKVALKIIKLGMDTRQVIARFEAERQALAVMDHPNIARVLDAGATETGRPYFVMELVNGEPITAYCDSNSLSIRERLELFGQVCQAVQHAHAKGIIHRDLKPSNVLVSTQDGRPHARVIDFGIAKATSSRLTEKTLFTEHRQFVGTPEYMSPEQAEGSLDIDTRSDVYSLGVLLYELLVGQPPFDPKSLRSAAYSEIQRIIREVDPPRPSTRLSSSGTLAAIAAHRHTEPVQLGRLIRGDLDWIVMKALEKDRLRRYETASGLALDVQRHLAGEAVLAAPPSATYRLRKFVARHRVGVAAAAVVALALVLGVLGTSIALVHAERQRRLAERNQTRAVLAEADAQRRADQIQQVAEFQASMLRQIDAADAGRHLAEDIRERYRTAVGKSGDSPEAVQARIDAFESELRQVNFTATASTLIDRTVLAPAESTVEAEFGDQPIVSASLSQTLADAYIALGDYPHAMRLQERALDLRRSALGELHEQTINSMLAMGLLLDEAGQLSAAAELEREALDASRRGLGEKHRYTLDAMNNYGLTLRHQNELEAGEKYIREAMEGRRSVLGESHPDSIASLINLGTLRQAQGDYQEAESLLREAVELSRSALGEDHEFTGNAMAGLGTLLLEVNKLAESESWQREVLRLRRRAMGEDHPRTIDTLQALAHVLKVRGNLGEAGPLYREALDKSGRLFGDDHPRTIEARYGMAILLQAQGNLEEAEQMLTGVLDGYRRTLGEEHVETLGVMDTLASMRWRLGRLADAEKLCAEALEKRRRILGPDHPDTLTSSIGMGLLLSRQNRPADAEPYYRAAVDGLDRSLGPEHWRTAQARMGLGRILTATQRFGEAEAELLEAERVFANAEGVLVRERRPCIEAIVALYQAWHAADPGLGHDARQLQWQQQLEALLASQPAGS